MREIMREILRENMREAMRDTLKREKLHDVNCQNVCMLYAMKRMTQSPSKRILTSDKVS